MHGKHESGGFMKRLYKIAFAICLALSAMVGGLIFKRVSPKSDLVSSFCTLKSDAESFHFHAFSQQCDEQQTDYFACVKQFISQKKEAGLQAVRQEWRIDRKQLAQVLERQKRYVAHMRGDVKEGHLITVPRSFSGMRIKIKDMISDILNGNGIRNARVEVVSSHTSCPVIFFYDYTSDFDVLPHFILELPKGFERQNESFQRGNLEHELMHLVCGHGIAIYDLGCDLEERHTIARDYIFESSSFQKLRRAYEYEADLMPSLKHPEIASSVLCALNEVTLTDDGHPSTRKRKKMVMRVQRLGELESLKTI